VWLTPSSSVVSSSKQQRVNKSYLAKVIVKESNRKGIKRHQAAEQLSCRIVISKLMRRPMVSAFVWMVKQS